jgi:hypothetical protein
LFIRGLILPPIPEAQAARSSLSSIRSTLVYFPVSFHYFSATPVNTALATTAGVSAQDFFRFYYSLSSAVLEGHTPGAVFKMTLKEVYQRFLDLPNPLSLSDNASLHYVTTLSTFSSSADIVRHLELQNRKVVRTKNTRVLSAVEGSNGLALEVETVLEFIASGGTYLPGLENFIVDKVAVIPTVGTLEAPTDT